MRVAIMARARTPIGSFLGRLSQLPAPKLASFAIQAALKQISLKPSDIQEVIFGHVLSGGVGQAPARQAALLAGLPSSVPCTTVNKVCGSGLKAVLMASQSIQLRESDIVVAGGMESMSKAPYVLQNTRAGFRIGDQIAVDSMIEDGLLDPYSRQQMGTFGDQCALEFHFTREQQDQYAIQSYEKALRAQKNGFFKDEIVPVSIVDKKQSKTIEEDEEPGRYQPDKIPSLTPAFSKNGSVTAANASKLNDGAAALVLMSEEEVKKRQLQPKAWVVSYATFAHDPAWFTTAPIEAIRLALQKANLSISDVDLFEINEAFSVVPMIAIAKLGLDPNRVNIWGGAVALGHPIGCSGARILTTLISALTQTNGRIGCASICLGGGEAIAMVVQR